MLTCLYLNGTDKSFLENCLAGLSTDMVSVKLGHKAGLTAKEPQLFPKVIGWHCFNHRLELSLGDAVKSCTEINHFKICMYIIVLCV